LYRQRLVETDFAELEGGTLIEMIGDPGNASKTVLAVWKDGKASFTDRYHYRDRVFIPIPRDQSLIRHVRLPRGTKDYPSVCS